MCDSVPRPDGRPIFFTRLSAQVYVELEDFRSGLLPFSSLLWLSAVQPRRGIAQPQPTLVGGRLRQAANQPPIPANLCQYTTAGPAEEGLTPHLVELFSFWLGCVSSLPMEGLTPPPPKGGPPQTEAPQADPQDFDKNAEMWLHPTKGPLKRRKR